MQKGLLIYLIVMNLIGLAVMAMDKSKARASCMADTGENTFPCEYFRRQCRNVGRHVSVSS